MCDTVEAIPICSLIEVRRPIAHPDQGTGPDANLIYQGALRFGDPMPFIIDWEGRLIFLSTVPGNEILPPFVIAIAPLPDTHPQHPNHQEAEAERALAAGGNLLE